MKIRRMPSGESVSTAALAYRMWGAASSRGWDLTLADLADALGEPLSRVRRVAQIKQWLTRFRSTLTDPSDYAGLTSATDEALEAMGRL